MFKLLGNNLCQEGQKKKTKNWLGFWSVFVQPFPFLNCIQVTYRDGKEFSVHLWKKGRSKVKWDIRFVWIGPEELLPGGDQPWLCDWREEPPVGKTSWQTGTPPHGAPETQQRITQRINGKHNSHRTDGEREVGWNTNKESLRDIQDCSKGQAL